MSLKGATFFDQVEETQLSLSFGHIAGIDNTDADEQSRRKPTHADWKLHPSLFKQILQHFGARPTVDLFASAQNRQLKTFFSYHFDHRSAGVDAFQQQWNLHRTLYAYPPPSLLGRVLQRYRETCCDPLVLIFPVWMAQTWFPSLLEMLRLPPILLPNESWIVADPLGTNAWPERWPLAAASLSGNLLSASQSRKQYLLNAGRTPRTAIRSSMTLLSKGSNGGGGPTTALLHSVLQRFGLAS
jgi:hypothetical protein